MKQLRNRADEDARLVHMSLQMDSELPSSLRKDLDHLMILVRVFHKHLHTFITLVLQLAFKMLLIILQIIFTNICQINSFEFYLNQ